MVAAYQVSPLAQDQVDAAFPLAHACLGTPDLTTWRSVAKRYIGDVGCGMILAERDGYIRGLLSYSMVPSLRGGCELVVNAVGVLELLFPERAALALVDATRAIARAQACDDIVFAVPYDSEWLAGILSDHAWHEAGRLMVGHRAMTIDTGRRSL